MHILCTLRNVKSFLGVYPSDLLLHSIAQPGTVIINADPHTEKGSHWLAIHFERKASSAYYFDSYGISPLVPAIHAFLRPALSAATTAAYSPCTWTEGTPQKNLSDFSTLTWLTGKLKNCSHPNSDRCVKIHAVVIAARALIKR